MARLIGENMSPGKSGDGSNFLSKARLTLDEWPEACMSDHTNPLVRGFHLKTAVYDITAIPRREATKGFTASRRIRRSAEQAIIFQKLII
jgi:hypothetical protein